MKKVTSLLLLSLALLWISCDERTERTDTGGILLEVEFTGTGVPVIVSVNNNFAVSQTVTVGTMEVSSVVANPNGVTSSLMDVELESFEVTFQRVDSGTRVPPPYVERVLATVTAGGTATFNNWPIMSVDQLRNPPLSELLFENGGFDTETGDTVVRMDVFVRVFGRTLSNRRIASIPRPHTIEFRQ